MKIPDISFFADNEVLFVGYSRNPQNMSRHIAAAFRKNNIKVYPLNPNSKGSYDTKVYSNYEELDHIPETAYIILNQANSAAAFEQIKQSGIKRVLFHSKKSVTPAIMEECEKLGIEVAANCPMMILGGGIHKVHRFFAELGK